MTLIAALLTDIATATTNIVGITMCPLEGKGKSVLLRTDDFSPQLETDPPASGKGCPSSLPPHWLSEAPCQFGWQ